MLITRSAYNRPTEEQESNRSPFEEIPTPIIWDILSRVPTKALLNCKSVCKEWYEIIITPDFASFRSSIYPYNTILLHDTTASQKKKFMLLDLDKSPKVDEMGNISVGDGAKSWITFKSEVTTPQDHDLLHLVNECNGLICLSTKTGQEWTYNICNILTGQEVIVEQLRYTSCYVEVFGLGRCPASHNFKVLGILKSLECDRYMAVIQTLGSSEWRPIGNAPDLCDTRGSKAFLHGSLHVFSYRDKCIWSFDFGNEQFLPIAMPDDLKRNDMRVELSVFVSCLCLRAFIDYSDECEIWLMKEYGVQDSWVRYFVIHDDSSCMPLLQLDTGEILVDCYRSTFVGPYRDVVRLGAFDIESGRLRKVQIPGIYLYTVVACDIKFPDQL